MEVGNYALAVGYDDKEQPQCIILSSDAMEVGGAQAMKATQARMIGGDLHLTGEGETVVIKQLVPKHIALIEAGLPVVVIDLENEAEVLIPSK